MSESTSSPSSNTESIGCVSSLVNLLDTKLAQRHSWHNPILSPRMQPISIKVAAVLAQSLPEDALGSMSDSAFDKVVSRILGLMHWEDDAAELHALQCQVECLRKEASESDEKSLTISRLTGLLQAKEEEIVRLHESWTAMSEANREKEMQRREKEVQLAAAESEIYLLKNQLKLQESALQDLRNAMAKMRRRDVSPSSGSSETRHQQEVNRWKAEYQAANAASEQPGSKAPSPNGDLPPSQVPKPNFLDDDDYVFTLTQQLQLAEEDCNRQAKLTDKYRQLVHTKDQELCAQQSFMMSEIKALHEKYQRQIQDLNQAHEAEVSALVAELEKRQLEIETLRTLVSNSRERRASQSSRRRSMDGSCSPMLKDDAAVMTGPVLHTSPLPPLRPGALPLSSGGSPSSNPGLADVPEAQQSPTQNELALYPPDPLCTPAWPRPSSRTNSVAYSLSSLSDSDSVRSGSDMQDAATQVDLTSWPMQREDASQKTSPDLSGAKSCAHPRRASGPAIGYRSRPFMDTPTPKPVPGAVNVESIRSQILATMSRLPLHKLQEISDRPDNKAQDSVSAPNSSRSHKGSARRASHIRAPSATDPTPLSARSNQSMPLLSSPRFSTTCSAGPTPKQYTGSRSRSMTASTSLGKYTTSRSFSSCAGATSTTKQRSSSPSSVINSGQAKSVVLYFPHPVPSPRHDNSVHSENSEGGSSPRLALNGNTAALTTKVPVRSTSQPLIQSQLRSPSGQRKAYF